MDAKKPMLSPFVARQATRRDFLRLTVIGGGLLLSLIHI